MKFEEIINTVVCGAMPGATKEWPGESVNCSISSPPFWALRDYGLEPIVWGGDKDCKHKWGKKYVAVAAGQHYGDNPGSTLTTGTTQKRREEVTKQIGVHTEHKSQFCSKCNAWLGSLGLEPTFELYIEHLCTIYDEVKRLLRKDGTCWVNLGDTYGMQQAKGFPGTGQVNLPEYNRNIRIKKQKSVPDKSLCLIPQRFAIEMVNRGWILRNVIIWHKPNPMPSSAKDRFTCDFEYVYFFVKSSMANYWIHIRKMLSVSEKPKPDYRWQHASGYELTQPPKDKDWKKKRVKCPDCKGTGKVRPILNTPFFKGMVGKPEICGRCLPSLEDPDVKNYTVPEWQRINLWEGRDYWFEPQYEPQSPNCHSKGTKLHPPIEDAGVGHKDWHKYTAERWMPLGRNKRCVWTIPTQPYSEAHFATFPEKLVEPMIKAGCPEFVCTKCGKAREKIYESVRRATRPGEKTKIKQPGRNSRIFIDRDPQHPKARKQREDYRPADEIGNRDPQRHVTEVSFKDYADCGCGADWRPGIVWDPFLRFWNDFTGSRQIAA